MNSALISHHPSCSLNRQKRHKPNELESLQIRKSRNGSISPRPSPVDLEPQSRTERIPSYKSYSEDLNNVLSEEAIKALDAVEYITEHLRKDNQYKRIREEWKYVSMVIDRLLLYVFFAVTVGGTCGIFLSAPNVFEYVDQNSVIEKLKKSAEAEIIT
uniref:Neurotransmitter-gated ion-channel transmembrane domain-containing protein n=1 Tax=Panagrolaimus sp. JU765 TaxID=591449 RepID=A0AC34PYZ1_9BILA